MKFVRDQLNEHCSKTRTAERAPAMQTEAKFVHPRLLCLLAQISIVEEKVHGCAQPKLNASILENL